MVGIETSIRLRSPANSLGRLLSVWVFALFLTGILFYVLCETADSVTGKYLDEIASAYAETTVVVIVAALLVIAYSAALTIARSTFLRGVDALEMQRWRRFRMGATLGALAAYVPHFMFARAGEYASVVGTPWMYILLVVIGLPLGSGTAVGYLNILINDAKDGGKILQDRHSESVSA